MPFINYQIPRVIDPISYSKKPLPPVGYASWLTKSVYQPYFTPYDANIYSTYTPNIGSYYKAVNLMQSIQDDFEFGGIDLGKWLNYGGSQIIAGTNLVLELTSSLGGNYVGIISYNVFNLTGSYAFSQVVDAGNQSLVSLEIYPVQLSHGSDAVSIMISGNTVFARKKLSGSTTTVGSSISYNSTTMKWFRIRESGGTMFWEYATDPAGSWSTIASASNPIPVTSLNAEIVLGTWQAEASTTTAKIDNFNVLPGSLQFNWMGNTWNKRIYQGSELRQHWTPNNVGTPDSNNYLTISITNPSGIDPQLAEFFSARRGFGYGVYTAVIATELDNIGHPSSFGGMFTFDFTAAPDYKEIDINEVRDYNSNPNKRILKSHAYNNGGNRTFITDDMDITADVVQTHRLIWTPTSLTFDSFVGQGFGGTNYFHTTHTTNLPTPGLERVHFNIWVDPSISGYLTVPRLDVVIRSFDFEPLGYSSWVGKTISQPTYPTLDINPYIIKPPDPGNYSKPPTAPVGSASWLAKSIASPIFTPFDINATVWNPNAGNLRSFTVPAPTGYASWAGRSISQPYFTPYDSNQYSYPPNETTYAFKPAPPTGYASWLTQNVSEPYFPAIDINPYNTSTLNVISYSRPPAPPADEADWLGSSIYQPYFPALDINPFNTSTPNVGTYYKAPPPPPDEADWLPHSIYQPYFTPYDVNSFIYPANPATYYKAPPAPVGSAAWLSASISQPYLTPYNELLYGISPVNVGTYYRAPQFSYASQSTIAQPNYSLRYLIPNVQNPLKAITSPAPTGYASWASSTIAQPYILTTNNNSTVFNLASLRSLPVSNAIYTRMLLGMGL